MWVSVIFNLQKPNSLLFAHFLKTKEPRQAIWISLQSPLAQSNLNKFQIFPFRFVSCLSFSHFFPHTTRNFFSLFLCHKFPYLYAKKKKLVALHKFFNWLWQQNPLISFTVLLGMRATVNPTKKKTKEAKTKRKIIEKCFQLCRCWNVAAKDQSQGSEISALFLSCYDDFFGCLLLVSVSQSIRPSSQSIHPIHS